MRIHRWRFGRAGTVLLVLALLIPAGSAVTPVSADERCAPIAHMVDATEIPGNESDDPDGPPDEAYKDQLGLNCIPLYEVDFSGRMSSNETFTSLGWQKGKCDPESRFDVAAQAVSEDPDWYDRCIRFRFSMGPLVARGGMNDTVAHAVTFDKPWLNNGYVLRWKPGLQNADGTVPPVEEVHLHHATWIAGGPPTASGTPFFATGEEQTILSFPKGYGWRWTTSAWVMIYMLHNALPNTQVVYVTYDIDWIPDDDLPPGGIKNTASIWMDVGGSAGSAIRTNGSSVSMNGYAVANLNPIFNAQRGFGHDDTGAFWGLADYAVEHDLVAPPIQNNQGTGKKVCTWPRENCSNFDSRNVVSNQQGIPLDNVVGNPVTISGNNNPGLGACPGRSGNWGTLVNMGGHLHPGGLRTEVSIRRVEDGQTKMIPIHVSDAVYWDHREGQRGVHTQAGGPATSWDLAMTGQIGQSPEIREKDAWKILVRAGDQLVLNGVYDTDVASTYDQMGIVMSWITPGCEPDAIDPFEALGDDPSVIIDAGWVEGGRAPARPENLPEHIDVGCTPGTVRPEDPDAGENLENVGKTVLCLRGNVTRPSMPSRQNHARCGLGFECPALDPVQRQPLPTQPCSAAPNGQCLTIPMAGYSYGPLDMKVSQVVMPQIAAGTRITFNNYADSVPLWWHTATRCKEPCTGGVSANYPIPNGGTAEENLADLGVGRNSWQSMDFDSTILGVGVGAAGPPPTLSWSWNVPDKPGTYSFYCRIHPFMRGAFEVVGTDPPDTVEQVSKALPGGLLR